jgi:hypothetical protein
MEAIQSLVPAQVVHHIIVVIVSRAKLAAFFVQGERPREERADCRHVDDDDADVLFDTAITTLGLGWESGPVFVVKVY